MGAVTAIELIARYMLVRPLLQGAFLSDSWAKILAKHIIQGRMAQERDLLPSVLRMYGIKVDDLKLPDGSAPWKVFVTMIIPKRNAIIHDGDNATPDEAKLALECANTLRGEVVARIAPRRCKVRSESPRWRLNHSRNSVTRGSTAGVVHAGELATTPLSARNRTKRRTQRTYFGDTSLPRRPPGHWHRW